MLIKSVLEAIPVYWMALSWIPKGTLEKAKRPCFTYLWRGKNDKQLMSWVRWEKIVVPKALGAWGLKYIFKFSKSMVTKASWQLITTNNLWMEVVKYKYISLRSILEWVRDPRKFHPSYSVMSKAVLKSFDVIREGIAWKVGNVHHVWIGQDPSPGSGLRPILPLEIK